MGKGGNICLFEYIESSTLGWLSTRALAEGMALYNLKGETTMSEQKNFRIESFSLAISPGRHQTSGEVCLAHGTHYAVQLGNHSDRDCDAMVWIDGQRVGFWRVPARTTIELERPAHDTGRFTFYRLGTPEAAAAALVEGSQLGLVVVTFMPEALMPPADIRYSPARGGTGLSGESTQRFRSVAPLKHDLEGIVMVVARLAEVGVRPLGGIRPGS